MLSKLSCPPLISTAWIRNPWRSLGAQVSPVCPQISFVIPRTPRPGPAARCMKSLVFMFVKLFTEIPNGELKCLSPASRFLSPYKHIPVKFLLIYLSREDCYLRHRAAVWNHASVSSWSGCSSFSWWKVTPHRCHFLHIISAVIKPLFFPYAILYYTWLMAVKSAVVCTEPSSCKWEESNFTSSVQNI